MENKSRKKPTMTLNLSALFMLMMVGGAATVAMVGLERLPVIGSLITNQGFHSTHIESPTSPATFPLTLVDPIQQKKILSNPPKRIVSSTLFSDEILHSLIPLDQLEQRVVAVTPLVDLIAYSNIKDQYPKSIARLSTDVERIIALEPDLVVMASYNQADSVKLLLRSGIPMVRFANFDSLQHTRDNIKLLAAVVDAPERGAALLQLFDEEIEYVSGQVKGLSQPRVLYWSPGGYTAGSETMLDELITLSGGYNVTRDIGLTGHRKISEEIAAGLEPDMIILSGLTSMGDALSPENQMRQHPMWRSTPAGQHGNIHTVHGSWMTSASHYQIRGLWALTQLFHPGVLQRDCRI